MDTDNQPSPKQERSALPLSSPGTQPDSAKNLALRNVLEAIHRAGYEAESLEDAWGRIVRVQAEIALNPAMGSKATTAAKFLAQALGIASPKIADSLSSPQEIGDPAAENLLALIAAEKTRRVENP